MFPSVPEDILTPPEPREYDEPDPDRQQDEEGERKMEEAAEYIPCVACGALKTRGRGVCLSCLSL